ncbi:MAG: cation diffusion facilitator family transporter [Propionibacteriaceae bacterium]|nr:cation diffusion facilitator family transporter [Propionibacteriaceae bacterium]
MSAPEIAPPHHRYAAPADLSRYAWLSIAAGVVTLSMKTTAALMTGSVGLLSDAAETVVNLVAAIVALFALRVAIQPPDENHPYGHSKAEYFSAIVEGTMIFVAAVFIVYTAIERLINPQPLERLGIGLAVSVVASGVNGAVAFVLLRAGRKHNSAALTADGKHLTTDIITSAAVLLGVALVALTHLGWLDPVVALLAGVNIMWTGFKLIRDSVNSLMDSALPETEVAKLNEILDAHTTPDVSFHAVRTRGAGNRHFASFHVLVPGNWTVKRGHDLTEDVIDDIVFHLPSVRVDAHLEPRDDPRSYEDLEI